MDLKELVDRTMQLLRNRFGLDPKRIRRDTVELGLKEEMDSSGASPEELLDRLTRLHSPQMARLLNRILVGESYFFRDQGQFNVLSEEILPQIERLKEDRRILIWSAGCSKGEEPYSIAITVEEYGLFRKGWDVRILGTDLSAEAIRKAGKGIYTEWSFRNTPQPIIDKYFLLLEKGYKIRDEIREKVNFKRLNLMDLFAYPQKVDVIFCRNVLIYLASDFVERVVDGFYRSLRGGGWLFVGPGEINGAWFDRFKPVFFENALVYQKLPVQKDKGDNRLPEAIRTEHRHEAEERSDEVLEEAAMAVREGDLMKAETLLKAHLSHDGMNPYAYYLLGLIFEEKGFNADAIEMFRRALYLDMDFVAAHFHIANLYRSEGEMRKALRHLSLAEKLLRMRDEDTYVHGEEGLRCGELLAVVRMQAKLLNSIPGGRE
jgi:chemotaxis protein methyltransferase CheR